jgi:two-component system, NtrC family, response regulator AtoC
MPGQRVLVLDDERLVRWSLSQRLRADGLEVSEANTAAEAVQAAPPDAAILDYRLPDGDGVSVLKKLRAVDPDLPVIMLTAHTDTDLIVEAIKAGASDYITKPFEVDDVALRLLRVMEATKGARELRRLKEDLARPFSFGSLIGESEPMQRVKALAGKVAQSPTSTVLVTGESGTGKDLLAKVIHYGSSRAARPFMNITCSALPETLLESELFGHERGAFTDARQQKRGQLGFWMKSPRRYRHSRRSCCASWKRRRSGGWAARRTSRSMCASSPRPIRIWKRPCATASFERTCITG